MDLNKGPYTITFDASGDKTSLNNSFDDSVNELKNELDLKFKKLEQIKNPTQYVFINKSLTMNPGKVAAQVAHAQEELYYVIFKCKTQQEIEKFIEHMNQNPRTTIVLEVKDSDELYKVNSYLESCGICTGIYVDEKGENYLLEPTCLITEYVEKEDNRIKTIFSNFSLYVFRPDIIGFVKEMEELFLEDKIDSLSGRYFKKEAKKIYEKWKSSM